MASKVFPGMVEEAMQKEKKDSQKRQMGVNGDGSQLGVSPSKMKC
ncbi:hypothetical protein [Paenibacillus sp. A14]